MKVKLISYSKPTRRFRLENGLDEKAEHMQDLVAYCARVSNPSNQLNTETSTKLLNYLSKHKHWWASEHIRGEQRVPILA